MNNEELIFDKDGQCIQDNRKYFDNFHFTVAHHSGGSIQINDVSQRIEVGKGTRISTIENINTAISKIKTNLFEDNEGSEDRIDAISYIYRGCDRQFIRNGLVVNTGSFHKTKNTSSED